MNVPIYLHVGRLSLTHILEYRVENIFRIGKYLLTVFVCTLFVDSNRQRNNNN
jgi:hypothetical protein